MTIKVEADNVEQLQQLVGMKELVEARVNLEVMKAAIAACQTTGTPIPPGLTVPSEILQAAMIAKIHQTQIALPPTPVQQQYYTQPPLPVTAQVVPPEYLAQATIAEQMAIAPTQVVQQAQKRPFWMNLILVPLEHPILILMAIAGLGAGFYLNDPASFQSLMQRLKGGETPVAVPAPPPPPEKE